MDVFEEAIKKHVEQLSKEFTEGAKKLDRVAKVLSGEEPEITMQQAAEKLCNVLKSDESYFIAWQSNIAMAFVDAFQMNIERDRQFPITYEEIHAIANTAAKNFLNNLIKADGK